MRLNFLSHLQKFYKIPFNGQRTLTCHFHRTFIQRDRLFRLANSKTRNISTIHLEGAKVNWSPTHRRRNVYLMMRSRDDGLFRECNSEEKIEYDDTRG